MSKHRGALGKRKRPEKDSDDDDDSKSAKVASPEESDSSDESEPEKAADSDDEHKESAAPKSPSKRPPLKRRKTAHDSSDHVKILSPDESKTAKDDARSESDKQADARFLDTIADEHKTPKVTHGTDGDAAAADSDGDADMKTAKQESKSRKSKSNGGETKRSKPQDKPSQMALESDRDHETFDKKLATNLVSIKEQPSKFKEAVAVLVSAMNDVIVGIYCRPTVSSRVIRRPLSELVMTMPEMELSWADSAPNECRFATNADKAKQECLELATEYKTERHNVPAVLQDTQAVHTIMCIAEQMTYVGSLAFVNNMQVSLVNNLVAFIENGFNAEKGLGVRQNVKSQGTPWNKATAAFVLNPGSEVDKTHIQTLRLVSIGPLIKAFLGNLAEVVKTSDLARKEPRAMSDEEYQQMCVSTQSYGQYVVIKYENLLSALACDVRHLFNMCLTKSSPETKKYMTEACMTTALPRFMPNANRTVPVVKALTIAIEMLIRMNELLNARGSKFDSVAFKALASKFESLLKEHGEHLYFAIRINAGWIDWEDVTKNL